MRGATARTTPRETRCKYAHSLMLEDGKRLARIMQSSRRNTEILAEGSLL